MTQTWQQHVQHRLYQAWEVPDREKGHGEAKRHRLAVRVNPHISRKGQQKGGVPKPLDFQGIPCEVVCGLAMRTCYTSRFPSPKSSKQRVSGFSHLWLQGSRQAFLKAHEGKCHGWPKGTLLRHRCNTFCTCHVMDLAGWIYVTWHEDRSVFLTCMEDGYMFLKADMFGS